MKKINRVLSIIMIGLIINGCSSEPKVTELAATADPQAELNTVDYNLKLAREHQVDILSPKNFNAAKTARNKAVSDRSKNKDQKTVLHNIALSQAYLSKANSISDLSKQILKAPAEARQNAIEANAVNLFPEEMNKADEAFINLTEQIENNDTAISESKRTDLEKKYLSIELDSIKKQNLGAAKNSLDEAIKEGAKKLTPDTLAWADNQYALADNYINMHRHNSSEIKKISAEALLSTNRLLKMVRDAKGSIEKKPEQIAQQMETSAISDSKSKNALHQASNELALTQNKLATEAAKNDELESQVLLNQKYENARKQFTKEEAEVYKQGDKLLLRLKGLSFANNKSGISSANFALLAKVQKVILDLGNSQIAIEGHTDSLGGKKLNDELSTKRAEAVQSYLISNNNVGSDKISATGYGDSKPIATNKTSKGRSQNRRVDVIITAETIQQ